MQNCKSHSNNGIRSSMHLCLHAENGMHLANNHGAQIASNKIGCDYAVYTMLCYCALMQHDSLNAYEIARLYMLTT